MDLTREFIDNLCFTVKRDKYYLGYEVDQALDDLAAGVDALNAQIAGYRDREAKMVKAIQYYQYMEKQRQAEPQADPAEKEQLAAAQAQIAQLRQQLQVTAQQLQAAQAQNAASAPAAQIDEEKLQLAARAERSLAEFKAAREHLIGELTDLQTRRDSLRQEISSIASAAADHILALANPKAE